MFTPVLPGNSLTAWLYLKDSREAQTTAFARDPLLSRAQAQFTQAMGQVGSVADLMGNYQALSVALGAHGLKDDLPNRFFVQQVIEQGTADPEAFANRLGDGRYEALAKSFEDLGLTGSGDLRDRLQSVRPGLAAAVSDRIGDGPLALGLASDMDQALDLARLTADSAAQVWARAMENGDLAPVLRDILGLADSAASLDLAGQVAVIQDTIGSVIEGAITIGALIDPEQAFATADAYLGTENLTLEEGFSYGGLETRLNVIALTNLPDPASPQDDSAQWAALQADGTLRDLLAGALDLGDGFAALDAAGQIAALQAGAEALFGRSDFGVFSAQANLTELGDRILAPADAPLGQGFTLGGLIDAIDAVRDQGPSAQEQWQSVLRNEALLARFAQAYGLGDGFAALEEAEQIAQLSRETSARFGASTPDIFAAAPAVAELAALTLEAQIGAITEAYLEEEFRIAVGEIRPELRVALALADELQKAVETGGTADGQWFRVLGAPVLREAFETAFGLPDSFAQSDLDGQVATLKARSLSAFGTERLDGFLAAETQEALITRFLAQSQAAAPPSGAASLFAPASAASILATLYS